MLQLFELFVCCVSEPVEEGEVEAGGSVSRKQCIVSISPKMWKVSRFYLILQQYKAQIVF